MQAIRWERRPDNLRSPVLIAAFKGWNDAGEAATFATSYLQSALSAERVADFDPELLFDFQSHRPRIRISDGALEGEIELPAIELHVSTPDHGRSVVLLNGIEPSMRWPTVCADVLAAARELGVTDIVTLGALLADVPHTRPVRLSALASPPELIAKLAARRPDYRGPTGIVGFLHAEASRHGFNASSLWAAVPHYVGAAPSPNAALALLRGVAEVTGVAVDLTDMEKAVGQFEQQISEAVMSNAQAANLVSELEQSYDREDDLSFGPLPSGDAIAAEFERFLQEQADDDGAPPR